MFSPELARNARMQKKLLFPCETAGKAKNILLNVECSNIFRRQESALPQMLEKNQVLQNSYFVSWLLLSLIYCAECSWVINTERHFQVIMYLNKVVWALVGAQTAVFLKVWCRIRPSTVPTLERKHFETVIVALYLRQSQKKNADICRWKPWRWWQINSDSVARHSRHFHIKRWTKDSDGDFFLFFFPMFPL